MSSWISRAARLCIGVGLLAFSVVLVLTARGDRQFKTTDYRKPGELDRLATQVLPRMQYNANMVHYYAHTFADIALQMRAPRAARIFARKALYLNPNDWNAQAVLGDVAGLEGNLGEASALLEGAAETHPSDPLIWERLANLYAFMGQTEKADDARRRSGAEGPSKPQLLQPPRDARLRGRSPVTFDWSDAINTEHYEFYLWKRKDGIPRAPLLDHLTKSEVTLDLALDFGEEYCWQVRAMGAGGTRKASEFSSIHPSE